MKPDDGRLLRHLVFAVALKLLVLSFLWWMFVHDQRVAVDIDQTSARLGTPTATGAAP